MKNEAMIAILAAQALLSSCGGKSAASNIDSAANAVPIVPTAKATRADLATHIVLTAEFVPYQEVDVMAKVAGYIRSIRVDIGDHVRQGEPIATLEVPEMQDEMNKADSAVQAAISAVSSSRELLQRAQSARDFEHLSFQRILDVSKKEPGLVPQQQVDEARSKDLEAEAAASAAKANLSESEERTSVARAEQSRLKTLNKYTLISAPFDGVVTKRFANVGSMIQAGTASQTQAMPVVRLSQNNLLRLMLPVPESNVPSIHAGEVVEVMVPSLHRKFPGRVTRFADKVQMATRTMDTEVDVPNPGFVLIPGMYAEVDLTVDNRPRVLAVPLDAVEGAGDSAKVFTISDTGTIRVVPVITGIQTAGKSEIVSGLREGDQVIVGRRAGLRNGEKVEPKLIDVDGDTGAKRQGS